MEFWIESLNGHDVEEVPDEEAAERVQSHLAAGKWATVENKDGSSKILTAPSPKKGGESWGGIDPKKARKVTVTNKMKGG